MAKQTDKYVNLITDTVTMSAANTITFTEVDIGLNIFDKVGLLVSRIEYEPGWASFQELTANGDRMYLGLVNDDDLTVLSVQDPETIDTLAIGAHVSGAPASLWVSNRPIIHDFSTLPGGGMLIPPKPLYWGMTSEGFAAAGTAIFRLYFIMIRLADTDYLELLQTRRAFQ